MSILQGFFQSSDTEMGVFYPKGYLIAAFSSVEQARRAERALRDSGIPSEDTIVVPGSDLLRHAKEHAQHDGLFGAVMRELSRFFGTEAHYADHDIALASSGACFLFVHCPTERGKQEAWTTIEASGPLVARYYAFGGIDHLVGETYH